MSVNIKTDSGLEKIAGNYAGSVTKESIGLGNVDNTSDANKPISTATQTALDDKEDSSNKVSGWQSTPDDNHYPSEKLVKDGLDAKVAKVKIGETEYSPASGIVTIPEYPTKLPASDVTDEYSATGKVPVSGTAVASAISDKEDSANRVSSWSGTTSHAKYPSEKLVKDGLDAKVNTSSVLSDWQPSPDATHIPTEKMVADKFTSLTTEVAKVEQIIGMSDTAPIAGVCMDYKNNVTSRLVDAVGKTAGANFDSFPIFGGMRRCNLAVNGTVNAYYGDANYKEDGSNGDVMVEIPKTYYRVIPITVEGQAIRKAEYYVCHTQIAGYKLHPAFVRPDNTERDYVYVSAYECALNGDTDDSKAIDESTDTLVSIANVKPASGMTKTLFRSTSEKLATNKGSGWHIQTIQVTSLVQLLMMIEYGGNLQNVFARGVVDLPGGSGNESLVTGGTSSLGNVSGSTPGGTNGKCSISYRGIENPWGNIWKFIGGLSVAVRRPYICNDFNYNETSSTNAMPSNYTALSFKVPESGWDNAFGYDSKFDWIFLPVENGGNSSGGNIIGDYAWTTADAYRIARLGGGWNDGSSAGGFCWDLNNGSSNRYRNVGARLCFNP